MYVYINVTYIQKLQVNAGGHVCVWWRVSGPVCVCVSHKILFRDSQMAATYCPQC